VFASTKQTHMIGSVAIDVQVDVDSGHGAWWCMTESSCRRQVGVFRDNFIVAVTPNASCWWLHAFVRRWCDYVRQLRQLRLMSFHLQFAHRQTQKLFVGDDEVWGRATVGSKGRARPR